MNFTTLKFSNSSGDEFVKVLNRRIRLYFKENNLSRTGNYEMVLKTIFMFSLYFIPYFVLIFGFVTNPWMITLMWILMGFGMAGIGLSVMHDANHGAYSSKKTVNDVIGRVLIFLGGYAPNWKLQHNVLHHTYTNVHGYDEDIDAPSFILRFDPHQKRNKLHRYQHIYAWFFYGLMTLMWATSKDFKQLFRYKKMGITKLESNNFGLMLTEMIVSKLVYHFLFLVLPILLLPVAWWVTLLLFLLMHFIAGLILAMIFQPAHVMQTTEFPLPKDGTIENDFAVHQILTTTNFAPENKIFSWFVGGLNYQIEHHLFPNVCHIHYKNLSKIVRETTKEYGLPYNSQDSFWAALRMHTQMLRQLGRA
ncbi:MAG: fatty acid desaturase family protein [Flavobacteriales bacterium]